MKFSPGKYHQEISIHAPREGSDIAFVSNSIQFPISIHAPREGSDLMAVSSSASRVRFQSTLPARGATGPYGHRRRDLLHFNPRSPRGERRGSVERRLPDRYDFNPRSPRGERRVSAPAFSVPRPFQSTLPARGATDEVLPGDTFRVISIHAPREGSDDLWRANNATLGISIHAPREGSDRGGGTRHCPCYDFNPRSPRGERL